MYKPLLKVGNALPRVVSRVGPSSGWAQAGYRVKFVKMFRADFGLACTFFSQQRTLLSPVTVEAIELIKSSIKND